jgi:DNA-binding MarR family transcriptional regulator
MATRAPRSDQPLSPDEEALIRSLARVVYALPRAIEADLVREQHMSLSDYVTLMHLSEAPDRLMRMSELAEAIALSLSGTTHIVTRLEAQGLIERVRSTQDARGWNAVLTDAGLARLERAWPTNLASVRRHALDHLAGIDLAKLARALERFATCT